jgi:DNA-directed RNA polymerase
MSLEQRQIELEKKYSHEAVLAGMRAVEKAFAEGRVADIPAGRVVISKAFNVATELIDETKASRVRGQYGTAVKYIRALPSDLVAVIGLREVLNSIASQEILYVQDILRNIGKLIETEYIIHSINEVAPILVEKVERQLRASNTKATHHIKRTMLRAAESVHALEIEPWTSETRIIVGRVVLDALYKTGLFDWRDVNVGKGRAMKAITPAPELAKHLLDAVSAAQAIVKYPPMLVKPNDWCTYNDGGYLTRDMRLKAPMMSMRFMRKDYRKRIVEGLALGKAQEAKDAANKAQSTPYRVNKRVLEVFRKALGNPSGILGLPAHGELPKPDFPFQEGWLRDEATPNELDAFKLWKGLMVDWYRNDNRRKGQKAGLVQKAQELSDYKDEAELYFPAFFDWRGRMYFRSTINPQSHDAVKGSIEFAHGKPLGERGLFWLKVHVANSCGYDKHDPVIKAQWVDDNWGAIQEFLNNPLEAECPEPDTAFTLLAAGWALQDALALPDPRTYVCHVPVAMDATCSGLQHFSALLRDEVGGKYTNLVDAGGDTKQDIYKAVAACAMEILPNVEERENVLQWWQESGIPRSMAKRPVMTYVYSATLKSCIGYVAEEIFKMDKSLPVGITPHALAAPAGKALRAGVEATVPSAAAGMKFLQSIVRNTEGVVHWVTPVGIPVLNWSEIHEVKQVFIKSCGIFSTMIRRSTGEYDRSKAVSGIAPNLIHSLDSAHLCKTINAASGSILPIHDSFATHPCDVDDMHVALRTTFVDMYKTDILSELVYNLDLKDNSMLEHPPKGTLNMQDILSSRFMFC